MAKIGVVVPVYNAEEYLPKCIESILMQTHTNLEIVLVDDGSTDNSGRICDIYASKDSRIRVFHQNNLGPAYARYVGTCAVEADYVTFVDADDWLDIHTYEYVSSYLNEDIDMVAYGIIRYKNMSAQMHELNVIEPGKYNRKRIEDEIIPTMLWDSDIHSCGIDASLWSKVAKKHLWIEQLAKVKELHIHYGEDVAVLYPMVMNMKNIVIMNQCLYYHRQRIDGEYPSYLKNEQFYEKLYLLYTYLRESFEGKMELQRQLEYFYMHAIEMRLQIYGERRVRKTYTFPFDEIAKDSTIILYGAGAVGQEFYRQVKQLNYCNIILWIDKKFQIYKNYNVKHPDILKEKIEFDYIVIANASECVAKEIKSYLLAIEIEEEKIVWSAKGTGGKYSADI